MSNNMNSQNAFSKITNMTDIPTNILNNFRPVSDLNNESSYMKTVLPREPSLNVGLNYLPIKNNTILPNQLTNSLDLLAQTEQLAISGYNKKTKGLSSLVDDNLDNTDKSGKSENTIGARGSTLKASLSEETKPDTRQIQSYATFVQPRDPSLNVGLVADPIKNMTILPNQVSNSLDFLVQNDKMAFADYNKKSNYVITSNIVATNEIKEPISKFQGVATPHIPYPELGNPTSYFNNFNETGRADIVREYICHVNSIDRDIKRYPSPFNFLVKCAPLAGDTDAAISRTFMNVRYIKIEAAVLPRKYYITKKVVPNNNNIVGLFTGGDNLPDSNTVLTFDEFTFVIIYSDTSDPTKKIINYTLYESDISKSILLSYECIFNILTNTYTTYLYELNNVSLENDKYTILYLNDINDVSNFSTDKALSNAFNVLYPDITNGDFLYTDSNYVDKIYKYSELGNLNRMLLRLTDSTGKNLTTNTKALDYSVPTINAYTCTCVTDNDGNIVRDYKCICNYIRHPKYLKIQIDIMFKFGIIETDFDKRAFN